MRTGRPLGAVAVAVAIAAVLSACATQAAQTDDAAQAAPPVNSPTATASAEPAPGSITFVSVVDGDTIETSAGTIRIIGIDTPERGECGHDHASAALTSVLVPGEDVVVELPAGQNDQDRYGRLIRYVSTAAGVDLGLVQLQAGNAVARYDSRDGYPAHPREAEYHSAQRASSGPDGSVVTVTCQTAAVPPPPSSDAWWEQYSSCTKLKKNGSGHPTGPFHRDDPAQAAPYEWFANGTGHGGDGDLDGLACE